MVSSDENTTEIMTDDEVVVPVSYSNIEEAILGIFMQDEDAAAYIAQCGIGEEHFLKHKNKILFKTMLSVRLNKGCCNFDLVADECEKQTVANGQPVMDFIGGIKELNKLLLAPNSTNLKAAEEYVKLVFEQWRLSHIREAGRFLSSVRRFDQLQIVDKVAELQSALSEDTLQKHGLVSIDSLVTDAYSRYKDRKASPERYIGLKSGFSWLDKYRAIAKKRTCTVGARTSIGKSILVSNIITRLILDGKHVLLFTPELDKEEYVDRIICAEANVPIDDWKLATPVTQTELKRISDFQQQIFAAASNNLYIEDRGVQTCSFILTSVKRHMLNHVVDVVAVDYLQKLKYYGETKKAITEIMGNLFSFAKDNDIAMMVVSQLRRSEKPEPELSDLKESGDIENFSDSVILLHRNSITKINERNKAWYKIAKNRQGATTDQIDLTFNEQTLRFKEIVEAPSTDLLSDEEQEGKDE